MGRVRIWRGGGSREESGHSFRCLEQNRILPPDNRLHRLRRSNGTHASADGPADKACADAYLARGTLARGVRLAGLKDFMTPVVTWRACERLILLDTGDDGRGNVRENDVAGGSEMQRVVGTDAARRPSRSCISSADDRDRWERSSTEASCRGRRGTSDQAARRAHTAGLPDRPRSLTRTPRRSG